LELGLGGFAEAGLEPIRDDRVKVGIHSLSLLATTPEGFALRGLVVGPYR
jgi:hypothetical protein